MSNLNSIVAATKTRLSNSSTSAQSALFPFITISRSCGAGGNALALQLKNSLNGGSDLDERSAWHIFDRNVATQFTNNPNLKKDIDDLFSDDYHNQIQEFVAELFAKKRPQDLALYELSELSRKVAYAGKSIFVGFGANMATRSLNGGLHIRLVAPEQQRIERIAKSHQLSHEKAVKYVRSKDDSYTRMYKDHFQVDIHDQSLFDLVFNTSTIEMEEITEIVVEMVRKRQPS